MSDQFKSLRQAVQDVLTLDDRGALEPFRLGTITRTVLEKCLPALESARRVRRLEWEHRKNLWFAKCILGEFCVGFDDGWHATLEEGARWEWEPPEDPRSYSGPSTAQEACQRYLESQVLSALE